MSASQQHEDLFIYHRLTEGQLAQFSEQGYLALGRTLTDAGIEAMRSQCMDAWVAEKGPYDAEGSWLKNALLQNIHQRSPVVRNYYFEGPLVNIATQVIGPNVKAATSQLTFKMRGNTMDFAWHQDNGYGELEPYNAISCLTALDDTDETNGCLWLVPGSHRGGQVALTGDNAPEARDYQSAIHLPGIDETAAVAVPMKAGECLFFTCWMLHKSDGNRSKTRDRRILFLRYADADAVEVVNDRRPRLGRLLRGATRFPEVAEFETNL